MSDRATATQLRKLAVLLHVPVERIDYLEPLGAREIAALREHIARYLHGRYPESYRRIIRLGRLAPPRMGVPFATRVLPPRMLGRALSGGVLAGRGAKSTAMLTGVRPEVLADAAPYLDPAVIATLLEITPPDVVGGVVNELMTREDFDTADLFADQLTGLLMSAQQSTAPAPPHDHAAPPGRWRILRGRGQA
ncbi:hypothetical protein APR11_000559 [Nocardia amikacinitolerans]|uniref:hypothetical protein n=1 Tax=Nocardia amikacinitolerans TaxID=756689 RepID=UPI0020A28AB5|nr:hypothetical protein [Nocardia amikacinitolerans]MCP2294155.1 hypothetical protein [Nocardia amikacinitolerans]